MKFFKGLALSLAGVLLFFSLSTFALAYTINKTLLNPDFVTSELSSFDIAYVVGGLIGQQVSQGALPEKYGVALTNAITKLEPELKKQVNATIYPVYDYLLGKSQSLDLASTLRQTVLSSAFVVAVVDNVDIPTLAGDFIRPQLKQLIPAELGQYLGANLDKYLDDALIALEPQLKEQVIVAADPVLDYLVGKKQSFRVIISLDPMKKTLGDALRKSFFESPPLGLAQIPRALLEPFFDPIYQQLAQKIPSTLEFNESRLGPEMRANIVKELSKAETGLGQARQYVVDFQSLYKVLIAFMLLLIIAIVLLNRQVRATTRSLGIIFLSYGIPGYGSILVGKYLGIPQLEQLDLPPSLQAWLTQFINDSFRPLEVLSIVIVAIGLALLIVSFVYKPRQTLP